MRLCANMPAQHAVAAALGGRQSINDLVLPGGRLLEQRDTAYELLTQIPGVTLREAEGRAVRSSRGSTPRSTRSRTTGRWSSTCCGAEKIMVVHGTGFNWPEPDHFRVVTLPTARTI